MDNFCFFIEKARKQSHQYIEIFGTVASGSVQVGDCVKYLDTIDEYKWQIVGIIKEQCINSVAVGEKVSLLFSMALLKDIVMVDSLSGRFLIGENYDSQFIARQVVVSCENASSLLGKFARIKMGCLFENGMIGNHFVGDELGRLQFEPLCPIYVKPSTKCILVVDNQEYEGLVEKIIR